MEPSDESRVHEIFQKIDKKILVDGDIDSYFGIFRWMRNNSADDGYYLRPDPPSDNYLLEVVSFFLGHEGKSPFGNLLRRYTARAFISNPSQYCLPEVCADISSMPPSQYDLTPEEYQSLKRYKQVKYKPYNAAASLPHLLDSGVLDNLEYFGSIDRVYEVFSKIKGFKPLIMEEPLLTSSEKRIISDYVNDKIGDIFENRSDSELSNIILSRTNTKGRKWLVSERARKNQRQELELKRRHERELKRLTQETDRLRQETDLLRQETSRLIRQRQERERIQELQRQEASRVYTSQVGEFNTLIDEYVPPPKKPLVSGVSRYFGQSDKLRQQREMEKLRRKELTKKKQLKSATANFLDNPSVYEQFRAENYNMSMFNLPKGVRETFIQNAQKVLSSNNNAHNLAFAQCIINYYTRTRPLVAPYINGSGSARYLTNGIKHIYMFNDNKHRYSTACENSIKIGDYFKLISQETTKFIDIYIERKPYYSHGVLRYPKDATMLDTYSTPACRVHWIDARMIDGYYVNLEAEEALEIQDITILVTSRQEYRKFIIAACVKNPSIMKELSKINRDLAGNIVTFAINHTWKSLRLITGNGTKITLLSTYTDKLPTRIYAPLLDIYLLARLFKRHDSKYDPAESKYIIIYAGSAHTALQYEFLKANGFRTIDYRSPDILKNCLELPAFPVPLI